MLSSRKACLDIISTQTIVVLYSKLVPCWLRSQLVTVWHKCSWWHPVATHIHWTCSHITSCKQFIYFSQNLCDITKHEQITHEHRFRKKFKSSHPVDASCFGTKCVGHNFWTSPIDVWPNKFVSFCAGSWQHQKYANAINWMDSTWHQCMVFPKQLIDVNSSSSATQTWTWTLAQTPVWIEHLHEHLFESNTRMYNANTEQIIMTYSSSNARRTWYTVHPLNKMQNKPPLPGFHAWPGYKRNKPLSTSLGFCFFHPVAKCILGYSWAMDDTDKRRWVG